MIKFATQLALFVLQTDLVGSSPSLNTKHIHQRDNLSQTDFLGIFDEQYQNGEDGDGEESSDAANTLAQTQQRKGGGGSGERKQGGGEGKGERKGRGGGDGEDGDDGGDDENE